MSSNYETRSGAKSADQVQQEVRESQAAVEETLEAIRERLSPGQMVDQAVDYLRSSGGNDFIRNLGATARDNPVPVALLGTGLAWLMLSKPRPRGGYYEDDEVFGEYPEDFGSRASYGYYPREGLADSYEAESAFDDPVVFADVAPGTEPALGSERVEGTGKSFSERASAATDSMRETAESLQRSSQGTAGGLKDGAQEKARSIGEKAQAKAHDWQQGVRAASGRARDRARHIGAGARRQLHGAADQMRHGARGMQTRAGYYGRRVQRGFLDTLHEQPLVLGALGLAVGAALGAAFPATRTEDEWMGETRDRLKQRAERISHEQLDKARAAGRAAYEAALEQAEKEGLTPEGAARAVDAAERKAERVAEAAREAAKSEAERREARPAGSAHSTPV